MEGIRVQIFFIPRALQRRKKNEIKGIENLHGVLVIEKGQIVEELENYFSNIFSTTLPDDNYLVAVLDYVDCRISDDKRASLDAPFSAEEIQSAFFDLAPWKVLGPDGFHVGYFQENWELMGLDVTRVCLDVLRKPISQR